MSYNNYKNVYLYYWKIIMLQLDVQTVADLLRKKNTLGKAMGMSEDYNDVGEYMSEESDDMEHSDECMCDDCSMTKIIKLFNSLTDKKKVLSVLQALAK